MATVGKKQLLSGEKSNGSSGSLELSASSGGELRMASPSKKKSDKKEKTSEEEEFELSVVGDALAAARRGSGGLGSAALLSGGKAMQRIDSSSSDSKVDVADKKEMRGWLLYDAANGAFFYGALNFLPLLILSQATDVARENWCADNNAGFASWDGTMGPAWNASYDFATMVNDTTYAVPEMNECFKKGWAIDYEYDGDCTSGM